MLITENIDQSKEDLHSDLFLYEVKAFFFCKKNFIHKTSACLLKDNKSLPLFTNKMTNNQQKQYSVKSVTFSMFKNSVEVTVPKISVKIFFLSCSKFLSYR